MIRRFFFGFGAVLVFSAPALAELAMTSAPVAMRAAPSGKAAVVQRVPASAEIEVEKNCPRGWRQASWRNRSGYIPCGAVVLGPPPAPLAGAAMPPPAVYQPPSGAPPAFRWTGAYVGTNFGFGTGGW
jgi:hypothetical protein